jgi:hypothetical protein
MGEQLKQQATDAAAKAQQKLSETAGHLTDEVRTFSAEQKSMSADHIHGIADAVHVAARELEQRMPQAASLVHSTATQLDSAAQALRQRSINELLSDVGDFARREPALFFGGAVLAGFALSRFLMSSTSASQPSYSYRGDSAEPEGASMPPRGMGGRARAPMNEAQMGMRDGL